MNQRDKNKSLLEDKVYDSVIIGGGINGAVAAAALSAKGAQVVLLDKADFAGFTSQQSSNLAWGGIKYMESWEFGLVRNLCVSRNLLMQSFPSTVQEIRFLTTVQKGFRHRPFVLWLGAILYWLMGNGFTQTPRLLNRNKIKLEEHVINTTNVQGGIEYSDAYLFDNDSRFVFGFVRSALKRGCIAVNYLEVLHAERVKDVWQVQTQDSITGEKFSLQAKTLINAAGAYVDNVNQLSNITTDYHHLFSKGIHLVVDRVTPNKRVLAFFASDGRLFFVIPMGDKTCVGTTDTRVPRPEVGVTDEDRHFVLDNINSLLALDSPLTTSDIIAERCGVRPLAVQGGGDSKSNSAAGDFLQLSRKHKIEVNQEEKHISIFGGKLTDCINVGDEICQCIDSLGITLPDKNERWYGESDDFMKTRVVERATQVSTARESPAGKFSPDPESLGERLWRRYGQSAARMLEQISDHPDLAHELIEGTGFRRVEAHYVAEYEMIVNLDDFLRRRTKISLTTPISTLQQSSGLRELCQILFGDRGDEKYAEYFAAHKEN